MSNISPFIKRRNSQNELFQSIKNKKNDDKIKAITKLLEENNTEELFLIEFLNLQKNAIDSINFKNLLEKYEVGIYKDNFETNFKDYLIKKSAYEKFIDLFEKLNNINNKDSKEEDKFITMIEILEIKNEKYSQTFPISYLMNKELFFNSLFYLLMKEIKKNYTNDEKTIEKNEKNQKKIEYEKKIDQIKMSNELWEEEKNEKILKLNKIIENISVCLAYNFIYYIEQLSIFIEDIYDSFKKRFENNNIFKTEKFDITQKSDIYLFSDFIYFLIRFDFSKGKKGFYTMIWNETFVPKPFKNYTSDDLILKFEGKNLKFIHKGITKREPIIIENIDNYINKLIIDTIQQKDKYDCFDIVEYLKVDKYYSSIFIKSHWEILSDYFCDILYSKPIQEIYSKIYNDSKHEPLDKNDFKKILDDLHFFNFEVDSVAETKKRFLSIYVQASLFSEKTRDINIKKCIYLTIFLIACIHEIIGHFYLRVNQYLYPDEKISSPMPNYPSDYAEERGKESGEVIEENLFGNYQCKMTMKEILFVLDRENYDEKSLTTFRQNFENAHKKDIKISDDLKKILDLCKINQKKLYVELKSQYQVNKSKFQLKYSFPQHHNYSLMDLDED